MRYIIAHYLNNEKGSLALKCYDDGKTMAALVRYLNLKTIEKNIFEIFSVSDVDKYGEYAPYKLIDDEAAFISKILNEDILITNWIFFTGG